MKNDVFRPPAFWKSAIMTMPDNSFFELNRSVFGKIKTPFNKQTLVNDLASFLQREDIQKTISVFIDQTDKKIIAAAALLNEPAAEHLESFFIDELSGARLQDIIVNLEERFILYRVSGGRLALNPLLKQILLPVTENTSALFPVIPRDVEASSSKKKKRTNLTDAVLKQTPKALQIMGLYYIDNNTLVPDKRRLDDFNSLETAEQNNMLAAAVLVCKTGAVTTDILPPLYRSKIREAAELIRRLLESLEDKYEYPDITLRRMIDVLKSQTGACAKIKTDDILNTLTETNLVCKAKTPVTENPACEDSDLEQYNKIISDFHSILEKMPIPENEKNQLSARIDRKLVLCESQLKNAEIRYEKLEARLMDYAGKQIIAKQAVASSSPLEIIWQYRKKENQIFGIPKSIGKEGDELYLLIDGKRIPLAKIILIRKIKKSIFEV